MNVLICDVCGEVPTSLWLMNVLKCDVCGEFLTSLWLMSLYVMFLESPDWSLAHDFYMMSVGRFRLVLNN